MVLKRRRELLKRRYLLAEGCQYLFLRLWKLSGSSHKYKLPE